MTRCGIDPSEYIEDEDFQPVFDFNTPNSVYALGRGVSEVSEEVLREIEATIKKYERQKAVEAEAEHGSNNLHTERGLSAPRHNDTRNNGELGQVRNDAEEISTRPSGDSVHDIHNEGNAVPPLPGNREASQRADRENDGRADSANTAAEQDSRNNLPKIDTNLFSLGFFGLGVFIF